MRLSNKFLSLLAVLMALVLASCSSQTQDGKVVLEDVKTCNFPDSPKDSAPLWVCDGTNVQGYSISDVGSYQRSAAGIEFMQQQALLAARTKISQQISTKVFSDISSSIVQTADNQKTVINTIARNVSSASTDNVLVGTKIIRSVVSPIGTIYVLAGVSKESYDNVMKATIISSYQNQPNLWKIALGDSTTFDSFQKQFLQK